MVRYSVIVKNEHDRLHFYLQSDPAVDSKMFSICSRIQAKDYHIACKNKTQRVTLLCTAIVRLYMDSIVSGSKLVEAVSENLFSVKLTNSTIMFDFHLVMKWKMIYLCWCLQFHADECKILGPCTLAYAWHCA